MQPQVVAIILATTGVSCTKTRPVELLGATDSADVLEISNGYGGKLMILSKPQIITPRRDLVRVDSFYADRAHPEGGRPPEYQRLLHWPSSIGTDTIQGNPALIIDGRLNSFDVGRADLFYPSMRRVLVGEDIATIGVLPPATAMMKYGGHGRNGAIIMTTKKEERPNEFSIESLWGGTIGDTTQSSPGRIRIRLVVDTTGHADPNSLIVVCRFERAGAFLGSAQQDAILRAVWKPERLHGRVARSVKYIDVSTPIDSTGRFGDALGECG